MNSPWYGSMVLVWLVLTGVTRADEASSAAALEKLHAVILRNEKQPGKPVVEVNLNFTEVTDAGLKELAPLAHLQTLDLRFTEVTDAGLKELAPLTQLQTLDLGGTKVTDAGLKELAPLTQLQTLNLLGTAVTGAGLKELALPSPSSRRWTSAGRRRRTPV